MEQELKVGDRVRFRSGNGWIEDVITYIHGNIIEGQQYDLSHINFEIINK